LPKTADIGGKRLISLAPDAWARWVTQEADVVVRDIIVALAADTFDEFLERLPAS